MVDVQAESFHPPDDDAGERRRSFTLATHNYGIAFTDVFKH